MGQQTLVSEASPEDHPEAKALDDAAASLVDKMNQQVSASGGTVLHTEALREMFNSLDKNGNAVLDHDELRTLCERLGLGFSDDKFGHMMKKLDPDGTGEVSFNDFLKWFMKKHRKQALKAKNITSTNNTKMIHLKASIDR